MQEGDSKGTFGHPQTSFFERLEPVYFQPCAVTGSSTPSGVTRTAPTSGFARCPMISNVWKSCLKRSCLPIGMVNSRRQSSPPLKAAEIGSILNCFPRSKVPLANGMRSTYILAPSPLWPVPGSRNIRTKE